jgi:dolichol-phosphate mannosyltransferase
MVARFEQGFDVVSAQRVGRDGEGLFKRGTASLFYGLMRRAVDERLVPQVGDFRLFSRAAVETLRGFREQHRFLRGLVAWLGLREAIIPFRRPARIAGTTKYPAWKMIRFAWTAVSSFSALPLKLALFGGLLLTAAGVLYAGYILYETLLLRTAVSGWSWLACLQLVLSGATLTAIGLVGDYVARIYEEAKGRPLYVVSETRNLEPSGATPPRTVCLPGCISIDGGNHATERKGEGLVSGRCDGGRGGPHGVHAHWFDQDRAALPGRRPDRRYGTADAAQPTVGPEGVAAHQEADRSH